MAQEEAFSGHGDHGACRRLAVWARGVRQGLRGKRVFGSGRYDLDAVAFCDIVEKHLAAEELAPVGEALYGAGQLDIRVEKGEELLQRVDPVVG